MFTLIFMVQDSNNMMFCESCSMNVFPSRPRFNIKLFGLFAIIMFIVFTTITILFLSIFSEILLFVYFMWGFMLINPYLIYYGLQHKYFCPKCYSKTIEKNLDFKPFGEKEPEIFKKLSPITKSLKKWHCPYCGTSLNEEAVFCGSCGKKFELKR